MLQLATRHDAGGSYCTKLLCSHLHILQCTCQHWPALANGHLPGSTVLLPCGLADTKYALADAARPSDSTHQAITGMCMQYDQGSLNKLPDKHEHCSTQLDDHSLNATPMLLTQHQRSLLPGPASLYCLRVFTHCHKPSPAANMEAPRHAVNSGSCSNAKQCTIQQCGQTCMTTTT